jgi:Cof subfamily protein (haloacid dehalogenase superfamily)
MEYRMIVTDMDGTLLTNDKKISSRNREALKRASEMGVKIVIATGRIFASAKTYGEMIGVDTPIIASNGAYIREKDKDEVIYAMPLGEDNAIKVLKLIQDYGLYCHLFTWDTIFTEKIVYASVNYTKWNSTLPEGKRVNIRVIKSDEWEGIIRENRDSILKAVVADDDAEKITALKREMKGLDLEIVSSYSNNFEVMHKGVSKGRAAEVLAHYCNLDRSQVICIGDNENDASMIEYAGLGIAMGNASEEARRAADFITLSNEEDGVAYAIEKFILGTAK